MGFFLVHCRRRSAGDGLALVEKSRLQRLSVASERQRVPVFGGLCEPLSAIGVWATRPHSSCVAAKEGDSPTFILCGCKGGRVAHIHPVWLQRWATRPHSSCVAAKVGESPSLLYPFPRIDNEPFLSESVAAIRVAFVPLTSSDMHGASTLLSLPLFNQSPPDLPSRY